MSIIRVDDYIRGRYVDDEDNTCYIVGKVVGLAGSTKWPVVFIEVPGKIRLSALSTKFCVVITEEDYFRGVLKGEV